MKRCAMCRNQVRKRVAVFAVDKNGDLIRRVLVCATCRAKGFIIIPTSPASAACACGERLAMLCYPCANARAAKPDEKQKEIARRLRGLAKAYRKDAGAGATELAADDELYADARFLLGRADGLEQAADVLNGRQTLTMFFSEEDSKA